MDDTLTVATQMPRDALTRAAQRRERLLAAAHWAGFLAVAIVVAYSAMAVKEMQAHSQIAALARIDASEAFVPADSAGADLSSISDPLVPRATTPAAPAAETEEVRWFNGRLVHPARTVTMIVTAYSPDERSCGDSADGITASLHSVETNRGNLVAADPKVLPLGSMVSIPGYDHGRIVPVLDKGGKIKGNRLDILYATHEAAKKWGVKRVSVTVWEYADGKPAPDWRKIRDSK
jgi:3D (Asp-Asp-Asp) domain-containing protein